MNVPKMLRGGCLFAFLFFSMFQTFAALINDDFDDQNIIKSERIENFKQQLTLDNAGKEEPMRGGNQGENRITLPMIGEKAPSFTATTTMGQMNFPKDYEGKWVVFFSHPGDFTPVCTTEFMTFANKQGDFEKINARLVGLSVDSNASHLAWVRRIQERIEFQGMRNMVINFPVIEDVSMKISRMYGMLHPQSAQTKTVRAVFIIDPKSTVRSVLYYPMSNGRNIDEIYRLLLALQTTDRFSVATPANWKPGEETIIPIPSTTTQADERIRNAGSNNYRCADWFFCLRGLSVQEIMNTSNYSLIVR